ncbi:MAG: hypothetical protein HC820_01770 [Hydrococcus sp. RM1_1_31]|nr:hypothetical protein [Hydrococcus sp. RM1_1_31]
MARRRGERMQVYVEMPGGLKYGFQGQEYIYNTYGKVLGQTAYQGAVGVLFWGKLSQTLSSYERRWGRDGGIVFLL